MKINHAEINKQNEPVFFKLDKKKIMIAMDLGIYLSITCLYTFLLCDAMKPVISLKRLWYERACGRP